MFFTYKQWEEFCKILKEKKISSVRMVDVFFHKVKEPYLVLKHDVETDVLKAFNIANIEHKYGHKGTYYVQAYLLENKKNIDLLKKIQQMGHEISYHYDVLDCNKGDIEKAAIEFEKNKKLFEENGFSIITVCQHGNPVVERIGYTSNRDFFRNEKICQQFYPLVDIMVNFKNVVKTDYLYFSDAGRHFQLIYDPINNDVIYSDDKNVQYSDLEMLIECGNVGKENCIISMHPHRWTKSKIEYQVKTCIFKVIKNISQKLIRIPVIKKIMNRYFYLAKKI